MNSGIIFGNKIIDIAVLSVFTAQFIKIIMPMFSLKKPDFSKMFETGGMPSSHSSSVTSICTSFAIIYGFKSPFFAMSFVLATIVMYDATGIRREAGKHAKALNHLLNNNKENIFDTKEFKEFKEFLGHSPLEVLMGGLLGIALTYIFRSYLL